MAEMKPYADDTSSATVGDLNCENGLDRISISGSLDLAKDRQGLEDARTLHALLASVIAALGAERDLPKQAAAPEVVPVKRKPNPFT